MTAMEEEPERRIIGRTATASFTRSCKPMALCAATPIINHEFRMTTKHGGAKSAANQLTPSAASCVQINRAIFA
jgi:hypothetical protein